MNATQYIVHGYRKAGLSIIPVRSDGSKAPAVRWQVYQSRLPDAGELDRWFARGRGVALICGAISGNLEVLDFDDPEAITPWADTVESMLGQNYLKRFPVSLTPSGGFHLFYRCAEIQGNQKLAQKPNPEGRPSVMIETRGEGGYVLIPPTPGNYHPSGQPYRLLRGDLCRIPEIPSEERSVLLDVARGLNRFIPRPAANRFETKPNGNSQPGDRPGDHFNRTRSWFDILEPHRWRCLGEHGGVYYWQRPAKTGPGCSATTSARHGDVLYVFSSNAWPFQPNRSYTKFGAWTLLEWAGDFRKAAATLVNEFALA